MLESNKMKTVLLGKYSSLSASELKLVARLVKAWLYSLSNRTELQLKFLARLLNKLTSTLKSSARKSLARSIGSARLKRLVK